VEDVKPKASLALRIGGRKKIVRVEMDLANCVRVAGS